MHRRLYVYAASAWLILMVLAILNGLLRNATYARALGEYAGHVLSSLILIFVVFALTYAFLRLAPVDYGLGDLLAVGAVWLAMTVAFEFPFGHYVAGHPRPRLLAEYNILRGCAWALVMLAIFVAPLTAGKLARRGTSR